MKKGQRFSSRQKIFLRDSCMRVALGLRQRRKDFVEALFCFVISSLATYSKKIVYAHVR